MDNYFSNIVTGVKSVFEGMSISLATFFTPAVTIQYPDVDISTDEKAQETYKGPLMGMPEIYRGILHVDMSICTACTLCMKACPIDCIAIETTRCDKVKVMGRFGEAETKTRTCTTFKIDMGKCMFCGLCVEPCKPGSIYHTNKFVMNTDNLNDLVISFVTDDEAVVLKKKGAELDAALVAKKAAKAAEDKKKKEEAEVKKAESPQDDEKPQKAEKTESKENEKQEGDNK